ncbi:MAG: type II toxin-antitoxin system VapC family toxin [Thermoanaerobaculia bacterium]
MPLLLDTGILYALADEDDDWHKPARDFLRKQRLPLLTPVTVLPEVAYLLRSRLGPEAERLFVESVAAAELIAENLTAGDLARSAALLRQFEFLGFVDASIVAVAERLRLRSIVTTDRRDFRRVRPRHVPAFELLP